MLACRDNGLDKSAADDATLACARSYRERMVRYSEMSSLDVWYAQLDLETLLSTINDPKLRKSFQKRIEKRITKETARTALGYDFPKLAKATGEQISLQDNPPTIYHLPGHGQAEFDAILREGFARYRDSLAEDRRVVLDRFELKDIAIKVVGVGSVGMICAVILLMAGERDPLFLQVKEARARCWKPMPARAPIPTTGSGWLWVIGSCSRPATFSSAGPRAEVAVNSTCANSGTPKSNR